MAHDRRDPQARGGEWWEANAGFHPSREMTDPRMGNERWFGGERHEQQSGYPRAQGAHWRTQSGWGEPGRYPQSASDEARERAGRGASDDDRFAWGGGHAPGYGRQGERGQERMADEGWRAAGSSGSDVRWHDRGGASGSRGSPYGEPYGRGFGSDGGARGGSGQQGRDQYGPASWGGEGGGAASGARGGQFSGRGPKGYKRSSERIREDVCERLSAHPEIDASEIEVKIEEAEVVLTGSVGSRREKRLAEDCCEGIPGVDDVRNELRVQRNETRPGNSDLTSADSLLPQVSQRGQAQGGKPSMRTSTRDL